MRHEDDCVENKHCDDDDVAFAFRNVCAQFAAASRKLPFTFHASFHQTSDITTTNIALGLCHAHVSGDGRALPQLLSENRNPITRSHLDHLQSDTKRDKRRYTTLAAGAEILVAMVAEEGAADSPREISEAIMALKEMEISYLYPLVQGETTSMS